MSRDWGIDRVQRFITLASQHHGNMDGHLSERPGCLQMRPDSPFLAAESRCRYVGAAEFYVHLDTFDLMIVPANSSQMLVGQDVQVQVLSHAWMLTDSRSLKCCGGGKPERQPSAIANLCIVVTTKKSPQRDGIFKLHQVINGSSKRTCDALTGNLCLGSSKEQLPLLRRFSKLFQSLSKVK